MEPTLRKATEKVPSFESGKTHEYGQTLRFTTAQLPELADWHVGEEYMLCIKVKQTGHNINSMSGKKEESGTFEVVEVGAMKEDDMMEDADEVMKKLIG